MIDSTTKAHMRSIIQDLLALESNKVSRRNSKYWRYELGIEHSSIFVHFYEGVSG